MIVQLLSITLSLFLGSTPPPNYYANYTSAREASKEAQKEMVVFFSKKSCSTCESAWSAFTKDAASTLQYVSARMDVEDFDGGICFELFGLKQVPAWVILTPGSDAKEKWEGNWKDASGKPTAYDLSVNQASVKEEKIIMTSQNSSTPSSTKMPSSTTPKESTSGSSMESSKTNSSPTMDTKSTSTITGFVLQAGYFGSEKNAQKMIGDLKIKGFSGFEIKPVQQNDTTFYRVVSKVYNTEFDVNLEQQRLSNAGIKTSVKKL